MNNIEDQAKQFKNACDYIGEAIKTDAGKAVLLGVFTGCGFLLKCAFTSKPQDSIQKV